MSEKERFIKIALEGSQSIKSLCEDFGISRKTGYKLLKRFNESGQSGLKERSRRPKNNPSKTKLETEELMLSLKKLHPAWGGEKLWHYLRKKGLQELPSEKTIDRILKRNGLITAAESEKHTPWKRFEHANPNDLWQIDFKGHFATSQERCHPLTVLDDHSRYSLLIKSCRDIQGKTVKAALTDVFREYGLPMRMTMDNGSPWGYSGTQLHTRLTVWLIQLGITVSHSRPNHPQTQGKIERFHRTLKLELLSRYQFRTLQEAQEGFDWWRRIYNEDRPHFALGQQPPAARYKRSERIYPEQLPEVEYESHLLPLKVNRNGFIRFKDKTYRVGEAFAEQLVGLKEEEDRKGAVYFGHQKVAILNLDHPYTRR